MRILVWSTYYLPSFGGVETLTHCFIKQLLARGHEVIVIADMHDYSSYEASHPEDYQGVTVYRFPLNKAFLQQKMALMFSMIKSIIAIINEFKPNLMHWHTCENPFYRIYVTNNLPKIPTVLTIHGLIMYPTCEINLIKRMLQRVDCITMVSKYLCKEAIEKIRSMVPRRVIYNGIECDYSAQPLKFQEGKITVAVISRMNSEKGLDIAIRAIKYVVDKNINVHLNIVGDGIERNKLESLSASLSLNQHISFLGAIPREEVLDFISNNMMVLIPSMYETFCLVAAEAGLAARPVIASRVGGLVEVIKDNDTGLLVEPNNPQAFADAIIELSQSEERMIAMGIAARKYIMNNFSIECMTNNYLSLYQELIGLKQACQIEN